MHSLEIEWRCRDGASLVADADGGVRLHLAGHGGSGWPIRFELAAELLRLNRGVSEEDLALAAGSDITSMATLLRFLGRLRSQGLLVARVLGPGGPLATVRPQAVGFTLPASTAPLTDRALWRLSRFALLRREERHWLLESTEAACDILMEDSALTATLLDAADAGAGPPPPAPHWPQFMGLLAELGFLESADEENTAARGCWAFHDRLFHAQTRRFGTLAPMLRSAGETAGGQPPSEIRPAHPGETIPCPAVAESKGEPLFSVMDRRRSLRSMGDPPVDLPAVAALLYRSVRVTRHAPEGFVFRPYPSGGAMHELEFYLAVRECDGLAPGFYHYRSDAHALTRLPGPDASSAAASMIGDCALAWDRAAAPPQCLIVMATRLPRVAWKYENIAYRLSLMSAGAVLQNLHLVATELGLNGCAAGSGRPELFARAAGLSSWEETSIGEFGFGSAPSGRT